MNIEEAYAQDPERFAEALKANWLSGYQAGRLAVEDEARPNTVDDSRPYAAGVRAGYSQAIAELSAVLREMAEPH